MQCFLKDADKGRTEDESVRIWVSQIREAAYEVEDVIETFALEIALKNRDSTIKKHVPIFNTRKLYKVGSKIEDIKTRILLEVYKLMLDEDMKVVAQLVNEDKHCQVVSICGIGGLGKTTRAKKVYHHSEVRCHFDGFAWAYISQQCKTRDVWEGILIKLTSPTKDKRDQILKMRDEELAKKLNQVQKEKRCLVILDDIWRKEAWDLLSPGCLNEEQSWELFQKKAFHINNPDSRCRVAVEKVSSTPNVEQLP
uniref:Uncharacterized protein n=1 Tax=Quercus lobata TaxID=97700 RepID=A0A7N2LSC3_QUELO